VLSEHLLQVRPDLPILLCTGYGDQITHGQCHDLGIRELIYKPVTKHELAKAIRATLRTLS
jgi:CheY-like chemotaxis protein